MMLKLNRHSHMACALRESYHRAMIAMLLLMATQAAPPGAPYSAIATARIVPGVRISLAEQRVQDGSGQPQRRVVVREESGRQLSVRLLEFQ